MNALVLDAGALIALDRLHRQTWVLFESALADRRPMVTHTGIVAQVWRQPARQARLVRALRAVDIHPLDLALALASGVLLAESGTSDVHDAALALLCRAGDTLVTSDPDDLGRLLAERRMDSVAIISP